MRKLLSLLICVAMVMSLGISASAFTTVKVTSIKLDKSNISLNQGQTYRLKATLTPSNTAKVLLKYSTGNNKIATVSAKGAILGVGEGKTTITVSRYSDKKVTASVSVTVSKSTPITLTAFTITHPSGISKEATIAQVAKATGITINWINGDQEKFKVLAASGSLPDMIENEGGDITELISGGSLIPLDSLIKKYGANIKYREPYALKYAKEVYGDGKATYFIPMHTIISDTSHAVPSFNGAQGMFARYDIYQAIGSPKISSSSDYLNVLKKMQDYQQKIIGNKAKVYAISAWIDWGPEWAFWYGNGFTDWSYDQISCQNMFDGTFKPSMDADSAFWKSFAFWNKAYRMGLVDPEGFTQKWDQMMAKVNAGTVITESASFAQPDPKINGKNAGMYVLPGVKVIPAVFPADSPTGYGGGMAKAITTNCKHPERAMQFFDYMASDEGERTIVSGVKGIDWDYVKGVPQLIGDKLKAVKDGTLAAYNKKRGISVDLFQGYQVGTDFICDDGYPADLSGSVNMRAMAATNADKNFVTSQAKGKKGLLYPGQIYAQWQKDGLVKIPTKFFAQIALSAPLSDDLNVIANTAIKYIDDNYASIIMAKTEADFAAVKAKTIADMKNIGVYKVTDAMLKHQMEAKVTADKLGAYK